MAFRSLNHWRNLLSRLGGSTTSSSRNYATSTVPKMKAKADAVHHHQETKPKGGKGEYLPVYVALGMITLAVGFGVHTMTQQTARAPNVFVRKSRRETIPEVDDPEAVAKDSERFINKSWFRQLAHVQDYDRQDVMPDPIRGDAYATR